jgi:uncharacterized coiled-coil protein SlyX
VSTPEASIVERLTELEVKYAYQSHQLAALDEVVREFAARVERLEKQLASVSGGGPPAAGAADEPPPHY